MSGVFTKVFGDSPQVRLLDFLADNLEFDYTISQLSGFAGLSRPTLYGLVERLTEEGVLVHTRTVGRSRFYRINREDPGVLSLLRLDMAQAREEGEAAYKARRQARKRDASVRRVPRA